MSAKYFHIYNGLRGMYMPDSSSVVRVFSIKGLKAVLEGEARYLRDSYHGASKRAVARLASEAWGLTGVYPAVMPLRQHYGDSYNYGLFVGAATQAEYDGDPDYDSEEL